MGKRMRLLMIEDEAELAEIIAEMLENHGYCVETVHDGASAFEKLTSSNFQLILLDVNLPDTDGFAICREIRARSSVPILFASARTGESDRITGFDIGGDDFIPKPYSMKELLSRINAAIRRAYGFGEQNECVSFGNITVDLCARTVTRDGKRISLSLREFDLLACLCRHKNAAVTKEQLLTEVWGMFNLSEPSTLTVHIRWLREKLEENPQTPRFIKTVYKVGYMLEVAE